MAEVDADAEVTAQQEELTGLVSQIDDPDERRILFIANQETLAELIGVDNVIFGSDYPHPEGLADPISYVDELTEFRFADDPKAWWIPANSRTSWAG